MRPLLVFTLMLTAAAPQRPASKSQMLADAEARPKLAAAALARPMRLVEPPPAGGAVELMQQDREKIAPPEGAGKPAPMPAEPKPPAG